VQQDYQEFLKTKQMKAHEVGIEVSLDDLNPALFDYQKAIVQVACRKGRFAIFADVGLGKTLMLAEWSKQMGKRTIIFAPLAVAKQTVKMVAELMGYEIRYIKSSDEIDIDCDLYITNYERLKDIDPRKFEAVVLDESSILKSIDGKTKRKLNKEFKDTMYRLCCSATPAPNDINELGSHSDFLGVMTRAQMCSVFFVNDSNARANSRISKWRLKGHAAQSFYKWLSSWSCAIRKPSDLGFSDDNYKLPETRIHDIIVDTDYTPKGMLPGFEAESISAIDAKRIRKLSIQQRADALADIVNQSGEQWIVWCGLNAEAQLLEKMLDNCINIEGKTSLENKVNGIEQFLNGEIKVLISKTKIAGMGMNLQHCHNMVYFGLDYSWESYYQALGRIKRFGQQFDTINIYHVISRQSSKIYEVIQHKGKQSEDMMEQLVLATREYTMEELHKSYKETWQYQHETHISPSGKWQMWNGDSVLRMKEIADNTVGLSVYSPPFADVFVYSNTEHDLGNCGDMDKFFAHYEYFISELYRITKPGRLTCVHVEDTRTLKGVHGFRGIVDFTGRIIQSYVDAGWIYRSRVTLDENPQVEAIRTKNSDLQFVTMERDATSLAPMAPDYILIFKKQGDNDEPVLPIKNGDLSREDWIRFAHPVWYGIDRTKVLNAAVARTNEDEKHMCPLQLPIIEACIKLYSNPNDIVFDPFAGIGSTVYEAVKWRRRGLGIELKPEYYQVAIRNCENAERLKGKTLFDLLDEHEASGD
jgi:DNA modification methylase/superfamily II DNA or RNA helicase